MPCATAVTPLLDVRCPAPIARRWSSSSARKNAHRGLPSRCKCASASTRLQPLIASGKNSPCATIARRTPLLPQKQPIKDNQLCKGAIERAGRLLIDAGTQLQDFGSKLAGLGATLGISSVLASAFGVPAEAGIVRGAQAAAVGGTAALTGSVMQLAGGFMASNSGASANGYFGALGNLLEDTVFAASEDFGLPGFPFGMSSPMETLVQKEVVSTSLPGGC
jgi:hypothetical protein